MPSLRDWYVCLERADVLHIITENRPADSQRDFNEQRPMVHAAHRGASQYLRATRLAGLIESKDVIDPAIVDGGFAGIASQITRVLQQIAVRLAIVLQVVSVEMRLVPTINFEVEITGDKNNGGA